MQYLILKQNFLIIYYTPKEEKSYPQATIQFNINIIKVVV